MNVLVVDDVPQIRTRLRSLFLDIPGVESVSEASGLSQARKLLALGVPDIIVLDLRLKGENGLTLLAEVKKKRPEVRVMVLTNETSEHHRRSCAVLGADYFFDKSKDYEQVLHVLAQEAGQARLQERQ